jgi:succinate dehydrogenase / fumarate reductase membrane anchor subunit
MQYRSNLSKAKNLGASGSGSHHWWHQRFTAAIMALMVFWLFSFFWHMDVTSTDGIVASFANPINAIMLIIFEMIMMYHGVLGMQVIIEDYVHCRIMRLIALMVIQIFAIITTVAFAVTILYMMKF